MYTKIGSPQLTDIDPNKIPQFIQRDFIDLEKIDTVSKFRSNQGHDYSDSYEKCRSMKHYFDPKVPNDILMEIEKNGGKGIVFQKQPDLATATKVFAPVDGMIDSIMAEQVAIGKQLSLVVDKHPGYRIKIFHVFVADGIKTGSKVKAGELIGYLNQYQGTDIAIEYQYLRSRHYLSYFQVMPDNIFANYIARGATARDNFIISKFYRDEHPLECSQDNDSFARNYSEIDQEINIFNLKR